MLCQLNPGSEQFNVPYAFRVRGALDVDALSAALSGVIGRHEILRTVFARSNGHAVQVVRPLQPVAVPVLDLTDYNDDEKARKAEGLVNEHARRPFDLTAGPLLRVAALKLSSQEHVLLMTFHHIIYDAWSDAIFFRELDELYAARLQGRPPCLDEPTHQYSDYAAWQRAWSDSPCLDELLGYWRGQLAGIRPQHLPTDYPRPVKPGGVLGRKVRVLDREVQAGVRRLANEEGMTDFIVLLAAFIVLLHAYLDRDDVYLCTPIANRGRSEVLKLVGYFVNFVIYRTVLSGNITFRELMARVCSVSSGAYGHQELPIQELVNRLDLANLPLSQVIFSVQNVARHTPSLGGLDVTPLDEQRGVDFDVFLEIEDIDAGLTANLRYRTDLFAGETMEQLIGDYEQVLRTVTTDPGHMLDVLVGPARRESWRARRRLLESRAAPEQSAGGGHVPPRDELELRVLAIWQELLERENIGVTDNFFALGGKSLGAIQMVLAIKEQLGRDLPLSALAEAQTVEQIASLLRVDNAVPAATSVVTLQPRGSKPPLFLLQPAASTPLHYAQLARYLAPDQPVYGFEQRGVDGSAGPHQSVEEMAAFYIREMKLIAPLGPYLLMGRCMGGIVAYEMALQLQAGGEEVAFLGILDTQSPPRLEPRDVRYYVTEAARRLVHYIRQGELLQATVKRYLWKSRRRQSDIESERNLQNVMDAHARARRRYVPGRLFAGALLVFRNKEASLDAQQQWARLATDGLEYLVTSGDHETMLDEPFIGEFAGTLRDAIDARLRRGATGNPVVGVVREDELRRLAAADAR